MSEIVDNKIAGVVASNSDFNLDTHRKEKYFLARRSAKVWPVVKRLGEDSLEVSVRRFLGELLKMPEVADIPIEHTEKCRKVPRSPVRDEVLVRFGVATARDEVFSHASNLKGKAAGVRLDIPEHLQADFRVLLGYGRDAATLYDGQIRRSVRFVDEEYGLCLNICLPDTDTWIRISPRQALETRKKRVVMEESRMRNAMNKVNVSDAGANLSKAMMSRSLVGKRPRPQTSATGANRTNLGDRSEKSSSKSSGNEDGSEEMDENF